MAKQVFRLDFCGRVITVETGEIAKQAGGSVLVRYDDTVVLSTATASNQPKEGIDFYPGRILAPRGQAERACDPGCAHDRPSDPSAVRGWFPQ